MIMKIKELREAAGLTQADMSIALGVAQNSISCWETETTLPRARQLPDIARLLGCRIDELFEDSGESEAERNLRYPQNDRRAGI